MNPSLFHRTQPASALPAGQHLRHLRRQAGLSQLDLALMTGVSQRHLSCVETGRAKAGPSTLHALLSALGAPLEHCNEVFLAAGYAPRYATSPLDAPALDMVHNAVEHILQANNPAPAIVIDRHWDITASNTSVGLLLAMVGVEAHEGVKLNLLETLLHPDGLGCHIANAQEVRAAAWQRASREAPGNPHLSGLLRDLPKPELASENADSAPVLLTRVNTQEGELRFLSTFTTFGMPQDISVESMRIEHLIPADEATWRRMRAAYDQWSALMAGEPRTPE
jgi:transcriptional regulator with XRE-family HTH domain